MKKVLAWVKANTLVVVFSAIIVISVPAAYFGASMWGGGIRKQRAEQASKRMTDVQGAKFKYSLAPVTPGGTGVDLSEPANAELNKFFAAERAKSDKAAKDVVQTAVDFNHGKGPMAAAVGRKLHEPLVGGLFPAPAANAPVTELTNRFAERLVSSRNKPSVYEEMLREILNAGEPVDPQQLSKQLDSEKATQVQRLLGAGGAERKLAEAEEAELSKALLDFRRRSHLNRAAQISVYATTDALPIEGNQNATGSLIPKSIPDRPPAVSRAFQWQMDYWMMRDLFSAIRVANSTSGGTLGNINTSVVKRVERISLGSPFASSSGAAVDPNLGTEAVATPATPIEQLAGLVPTDPLISVTGRKSSPGNPMYDVRTAELVLVVSSSRIKELFNAFARTNFMTITDIDLDEVDVRGDLERGYYYGPEAVVRASIKVETLWLRGWTQDLFPSGVRKRLGMPLKEGEVADDAEMASGAGDTPMGDPFGNGGRDGGPAPVLPDKLRGGRGGG
ncbi:MAG: hypothetical protein HEQ23_15415 [Tepidisphaera sp.]